MYDRVPQTRSFRYWAVPGWTEKDRSLLELAAAVLGDGKNSRLYQALVYETQYAVNVSVDAQPFELASMFSIDTTLADGVSLDEVNDIIDQEVARFLAGGPGEEELKRAKSKINAATIRGLERVGGFYGKATTLAQGELYDGHPDFFRTALSWINHADPEEVQDAARRWLSGGHYQLDVFPFADHSTTESTVDRNAGLPEVAALPDLSFPEIQRASLKNGMSVVLAERSSVPVVALSLQFDAGYSADAGIKLGTAGFTLSMMDESTRSRSALEIDAEAESLGAEISTASDLDASRATLSALSKNLKASVELFADVVRNPSFATEEMERLRIRWLAAIEREKNQPVNLALRTLPPLIYGKDHAYGIPFTGSGTKESISQLTRDDLVEFHRSWIRPDNATLFVVGDTTMKEILPMLQNSFGNWKAPRSALPRKNIGEVALPENGRLIIIDKPGSPQSMILGAHLAPAKGVENNIDIEMMNDVIGGQYAARVNQNLRVDKHWSYGAYTLLRDARGQRPWIVYAPVQTDRTAESLSELLDEFERFVTSAPTTKEELSRVYRSNAFSLPGRYETSAAVLGALQANEKFGRPDDYVATLKSQFERVNLEDIQSAAAQVLKPGLITWVIIGDRSQIEDNLRNLGIAEPEFMDTEGNLMEP